MAIILHLESSTSICSVSLAKNGELIDIIENTDGMNHAKLMSLFVAELLERNQLSSKDISAVAVSKGPGSYTGLRIGISLAKGICFASKIPLIAISPLQAMADHAAKNLDKLGLPDNENLLFCPMIDARRMEVYLAGYTLSGEETIPVSSKIIDQNSFADMLDNGPVAFLGNGAQKIRPVVNHPNAFFPDLVRTSAQFMCSLAWKAFENNLFEDLAYFEPFYLKDFIAGVPTKNILKK